MFMFMFMDIDMNMDMDLDIENGHEHGQGQICRNGHTNSKIPGYWIRPLHSDIRGSDTMLSSILFITFINISDGVPTYGLIKARTYKGRL